MGKREALQAIGSKLSLPTLPQTVTQLLSLAASARTGPSELGALVARDPGLSAKVLRAANSPSLGLLQKVISAEHAATVLGTRGLKNLVLQVSVLQRYEHLRGLSQLDVDELWEHSLSVAKVSQALAEAAGGQGGLLPADFYTCGLLHDIGKLVLLEGLAEEYLAVIRQARESGDPLHAAEQRLLGYTHLDVGGILAARWRLPEQVTLAITSHHGPAARIEADPSVAVVSIADQLCYRAKSPLSSVPLGRLADLAERLLGVRAQVFEGLVEQAIAGAPVAEIF